MVLIIIIVIIIIIIIIILIIIIIIYYIQCQLKYILIYIKDKVALILRLQSIS